MHRHFRDRDGKICLKYPIGNFIYKTGGWISHPRFATDDGKITFIEHPTIGDGGGFVCPIDLEKEKQIFTKEWLSI